MTLDAIFADANDFELCDAMKAVIEDEYGFDALLERDSRIPQERWIIHTIWGNTGLFGCEGYSIFWGAQIDHAGFAEAMREIRFPILASIIEQAANLVPLAILGDSRAVDAQRESEDRRTQSADLMDAKLITERPDILGRLATYIRSRRASFLDLADDIHETILGSRQ
jgi:hypothetical protein